MEKDFQNMDVLQVIELAQGGNGDAMAYLLEKYKSMVRALSRPLFLIDGDQDDLVQEGMIGLFKAIQTYDAKKGTAFDTFANLCITSQLYSAVKISNRKKNIPLNSYVSIYTTEEDEDIGDSERIFELDKSFAAWQQNPEEIVISEENAKNIKKKLISRLSKMEVQVLNLFLKGLTYQEIAQYLEKTPKTIDNALQRIKSKLKKIRKYRDL